MTQNTLSLDSGCIRLVYKYREKILTGKVAFVAEAVIRSTCAEMSIKIIDMAVNVDHVHIFFRYPPKYSVSFITKKIKGRSRRILRQEFLHLRKRCEDYLWAPGCYHGSVGQGWEVVEKYISSQNCSACEKGL